MKFTLATPIDAPAIAHLHATSWQENYRGVFSDEYLDGTVLAERTAYWTKQLRKIEHNQMIILAKEGDEICGFVCIFTDYDTKWGAYLDNLHVSKAFKRKGIGRQLLKKAAEWVNRQTNDVQFYCGYLVQILLLKNFMIKWVDSQRVLSLFR